MYASRAKYFKAYSSVRDSQVGYWFNLQEHPEIDQHEGADQEFLIIAKNFYNQNNLKDLHQQVSQLLTQSRWDQHGYDDIERQGNELTLIRRQIKTAPNIIQSTDQLPTHKERKLWGQRRNYSSSIKVRFLFTRSDDHA